LDKLIFIGEVINLEENGNNIFVRFLKAILPGEIVSQNGSIYPLLVFLKKNAKKTKNKLTNIKGKLSFDNLDVLINDIPRHNSFDYINNGSLSDKYFEYAYKTLDDPNIYIILSNTGSAAGELISVFTNKKYNHISLAFDENLETIISYNGGERVSPPGLNKEFLKNFNKKSDASIIVYKLQCKTDQKRIIIEKVEKINREGNAYNLLGLVLKYSHKPNIMFCSQFVYKMLKDVELNYFEKEETEVRPMDFIELDYKRKLQYVYEIKFNEIA
jgi:hypothetical protein